MDLEGLTRLGVHPLSIDVALLDEERLVFQLQRMQSAWLFILPADETPYSPEGPCEPFWIDTADTMTAAKG